MTGHFGRPFCLTLHKSGHKAKKLILLRREMSYQVMKKFSVLLMINLVDVISSDEQFFCPLKISLVEKRNVKSSDEDIFSTFND